MSATLAAFWLQTPQGGVSPWVWIVIVAILIILLLWWLGRREPAEPTTPKMEEKSAPAVSEPLPMPVIDTRAAVVTEVETIAETPVKPDDLVIIEGIGPKISSVLQAKGITTFAQLAAENPANLRALLLAEGLRLADPTTWPDQARLAAEGRWSELQTMQDGLRAGRKTE